MSKGEDKIAKIMNAHSIKYEREKTFLDLKHGKFRYDFYIPEYKVLIEVNGPQHYEQVKYFQPTRRHFQKQQEHDRRKISYALSNNYSIYCIPYWELDNINNFEDIFQKKFLAKDRWHNDKTKDTR